MANGRLYVPVCIMDERAEAPVANQQDNFDNSMPIVKRL